MHSSEPLRERMDRTHMMYRALLDGYPRYHGDTRWCQYIADRYEIEEAEIPQRYHALKRKEKTYRETSEKLDVYERAQRYSEIYIYLIRSYPQLASC